MKGILINYKTVLIYDLHHPNKKLNMNNYTLYFSLYGKKMKTTLPANSEREAKQIVRDKIVFHKIETNDIFQDLWDIVNGKR